LTHERHDPLRLPPVASCLTTIWSTTTAVFLFHPSSFCLYPF
jgi:hypothetical protein